MLFIDVLALPNASRMGLDARMRDSMPSVSSVPVRVAANARNCNTFLAVSDLPAPDSPEMTMDCGH